MASNTFTVPAGFCQREEKELSRCRKQRENITRSNKVLRANLQRIRRSDSEKILSEAASRLRQAEAAEMRAEKALIKRRLLALA